ncbi:acyloxyacyl hydrolase [Labilibacter marinus]|uniref:acyloxyacyl hydrolase n=1 Tax=Labilibacter marinus TaxID=1477105 RepID=UPI00094F4986|nr:acyloxyacyl hydrolase [Labilibacter marinus]
MKTLRFILLSAFVLTGFLSHAQYSQDSTYKKSGYKFIKHLDVRFENGAMVGNGTDIGDELINSSYYNGFDIRLGFTKSDPDDVYGNVYRRPKYGVGWYTSTFHNEDVGNPTALYFFLTMPFKFQEDRRWDLGYTAAFGVSYNINPYDPEDNPANIFLGSKRNCYVHLGFYANYQLADRWALNATLGFKHFSNGSFKQPNYGLNLLPTTVGVSYRLNEDKVYDYERPLPKYQKHDIINVAVYNGSKNYKTGGDNYYRGGIGVNYLRQINYKYRVGLGVDMYYAAGMDDRDATGSAVSWAVVGSWEWALTSRLYAPLAIGVYMNRNEQNDEKTPYYERAGLRYRFTDHISAGLTIKAHGGAADIFEWTVAYAIFNDPNKY